MAKHFFTDRLRAAAVMHAWSRAPRFPGRAGPEFDLRWQLVSGSGFNRRASVSSAEGVGDDAFGQALGRVLNVV